MMGFFSDKCPECGGKVRKGASFCPQCGKPAPMAKAACPACGKEVRGNAKFCNHCGAPVTQASDKTSPVDALNRWKRAGEEFARRIEASDLRGTLQRGLVVEPGTQALIFQGGSLATVVTEGTYDLSRPPGQVDLATSATAILVDAGETPLRLLYRNLPTREEVTVDAAVEVVVRLGDAAALYVNLMHGRKSLAITALADLLRSESANVVQASVRQASVDELDGNLPLKNALETDLRQTVSQALNRNGLEMVGLRFVEFSSQAYDKVRRKRAETFVAEQGADEAERRSVLNQRLRATLTRERMDKFTTAKELEDFVRQTEHELGMKQVIRQSEMEELVRGYEDKKHDAEIARRHLLEKLVLEQRLAVLRQEHVIDEDQLQHRLGQERKELESQQAAEWKKVQQELQIRKARHAGEVDEEKAKLDITREKAKLGMDLRKQKIGLDHTEESQRMALEQEAKDHAAKRELEKIKALSEVEQARLAADLQKTEVMKDMSEEQILAMISKDSPHVAVAIAERAKAQVQAGASAEVKALYEKLLVGKEAEADRMERVMGRAMESIERVAGASTARERDQKEEVKDVANQSMDRMADVAAAKAGASRASETSGSAPAPPAKVVCPHCHGPVPAGSKFCENCGHQFYESSG